MLSAEEFSPLVEMGHELRAIEFRTGFNWSDPADKYHKLRLIRSALGLSNLPDGGHIVLGIDEKSDKTLDFSGCDEPILQSFVYDAVKGEIDSFSDQQGVDIEIETAEWKGKKHLVIRVRGFEDLPTICRKDAKNPSNDKELMLRCGAVYVRSINGHPATIEATEKEMREVIEAAVDKQATRLRRRGWAPPDTQGLDKAGFDEIRGDF